MIDLQTMIDEINTGKIEFNYKDDDCCTTEGEVVIFLKRLAELEEENNRQKAEIERYKGVIKILENDVKTAKSDVVKEYKEKVKAILMGKSIFPVLVKNALDEAEKELVGR